MEKMALLSKGSNISLVSSEGKSLLDSGNSVRKALRRLSLELTTFEGLTRQPEWLRRGEEGASLKKRQWQARKVMESFNGVGSQVCTLNSLLLLC